MSASLTTEFAPTAPTQSAEDQLERFIRKAIDSAEALVGGRAGASSAHIRALALLWAAFDELHSGL